MRHCKKYFLLFLLIMITIFTVKTVFAVDTASHTVECGTDPKLVQKLNNALVQKKFAQLNMSQNPQQNSVLSRQTSFTHSSHIMPSIGDVKVLVVPIEFTDEKFEDSICETLAERYFAQQNLSDTELSFGTLSFCDYFKKVSFNKLRLSGTVLPVYTAKENREYYAKDDIFNQLVVKAVNENRDIIGDLSEYDLDNDGYIDCLHVIWAGPRGESSKEWWSWAASGGNHELYDGIKIRYYAFLWWEHVLNAIRVPEHETGHLLGLPDAYPTANQTCLLPSGVADLMQFNSPHVNALYRYILDWDEPEILPYENKQQQLEIYGDDVYDENMLNERRSVVFTPDSLMFPLKEFFLVEYRANHYNAGYNLNGLPQYVSGMLVWHCELKPYAYAPNTWLAQDYIKPVCNGEVREDGDIFEAKHLFYPGDEFSDTSTESSKFYGDVYTGAYMKVLSTDDKKATILAGFQNPDLSPRPVLTLQKAEKKVYRQGEEIKWHYSYSDYDELIDPWYYMSYITTGTVNPKKTMFEKESWFGATSLTGDGTIQLKIAPGTARKGVRYADGALSDVVIVDNTPPEIALNGDSVITLERGLPYIEYGAKATDNLDPDIENKLIIDSSSVNVNQSGIYYVYYNVTDHAGHEAVQAVRTVHVVEPEENKINLTRIVGNTYLAEFLFKASDPHEADDLNALLVYKTDDKQTTYCEPLIVEQDLRTGFTLRHEYKDCDIFLYVWDKNLRPLMPVQRVQ